MLDGAILAALVGDVQSPVYPAIGTCRYLSFALSPDAGVEATDWKVWPLLFHAPGLQLWWEMGGIVAFCGRAQRTMRGLSSSIVGLTGASGWNRTSLPGLAFRSPSTGTART